jgi:hypothetical protein
MHPHHGDGFDPLDLEIIDRVYAALCKEVAPAAQNKELRKRIFECAKDGPVDFDTLHDQVLASYQFAGEAPKPPARPQRRSSPRAA